MCYIVVDFLLLQEHLHYKDQSHSVFWSVLWWTYNCLGKVFKSGVKLRKHPDSIHVQAIIIIIINAYFKTDPLLDKNSKITRPCVPYKNHMMFKKINYFETFLIIKNELSNLNIMPKTEFLYFFFTVINIYKESTLLHLVILLIE